MNDLEEKIKDKINEFADYAITVFFNGQISPFSNDMKLIQYFVTIEKETVVDNFAYSFEEAREKILEFLNSIKRVQVETLEYDQSINGLAPSRKRL